jgi:hypothetical protein
MNKELEKKLTNKYPKLFAGVHKSPRDSCMVFGCEHGDGWFKIIEELCEKIKNYEDVEFLQIKEKFGGLRVYVGGVPEAVHKAIEEAEGKSEKTCEICGEPGKIRGGGWLTCFCDKCKEKRDARVAAAKANKNKEK